MSANASICHCNPLYRPFTFHSYEALNPCIELSSTKALSVAMCSTAQGLVYWPGEGPHIVVSNRISSSSLLFPGKAVTYVNSVAVAPNGKVYFTSSGHIHPPFHKGVYNTKMGSGYIALEVCLALSSVVEQTFHVEHFMQHSIPNHW